jgi:glycosyltransferase involved in cell wall biosynthesis
MPTISVLIPCFNAERYIGEALESALVQSHAPFEIIVVDDGSTDGSVEIVRRFGARVKCYSQPNGGISVARNAGLSRARGEWIAYLDADDLWPSESLDVRAASLAADISTGLVSGLVEQFASPELSAEEKGRLAVPPGKMRGRLASAMLVRREVFARVGGFDPTIRLGETIDWVAKVDAAGVRSLEIEEVVLHRRVHTTNSTQNGDDLKADYLRVLRAAIERRRSEPTIADG